jgi:hypothetical protein
MYGVAQEAVELLVAARGAARCRVDLAERLLDGSGDGLRFAQPRAVGERRRGAPVVERGERLGGGRLSGGGLGGGRLRGGRLGGRLPRLMPNLLRPRADAPPRSVPRAGADASRLR